MSQIKSLDEIKEVFVHWSESEFITDTLGCDDDIDINKTVDPELMDKLVATAGTKVQGGYDKTVLTIVLKDGTKWCDDVKFYLSRNEAGLLSLINKR